MSCETIARPSRAQPWPTDAAHDITAERSRTHPSSCDANPCRSRGLGRTRLETPLLSGHTHAHAASHKTMTMGYRARDRLTTEARQSRHLTGARRPPVDTFAKRADRRGHRPWVLLGLPPLSAMPPSAATWHRPSRPETPSEPTLQSPPADSRTAAP